MILSKFDCKRARESAQERGLRRLPGAVLVVVIGLAVSDVHADGRATVKIRLARETIRAAISGEEYAGTLEIIAPLEKRTGVPVISSMPHGLWAGAKLVGLSGAAPGYGELLSRTA